MAKQTGKEALNAEFEIIETKLVPATSETKGVQLFSPDNKEQVIQAFVNAASLSFSATPAQCKKLVKESSKLTIKDREDKDGYKKVYDKHREFVKVRTGTEKERKVLTDPFNQIKSGIDKVAKDEILSFTEKEEARLKGLVDQWKEWEQEEADRIEREEKEKLDARVKELEEVGLKFDGSFYSIGETISVDVVTIKDFSEESFLDFKNRVSAENEKIKAAEAVIKLHEERKEQSIEYFAYWTEEEKKMNFGEVSEEDFKNFFERVQKAAKDFEEEKKRQEDEKTKNENDRKELNYEKRSFQLEKNGFLVTEFGALEFSNEKGQIRFEKSDLEILDKEVFDDLFNSALQTKKNLEEEFLKLADQRKKDAEQKVKDDAAAEVLKARTEVLIKEGFQYREEKKSFVFGLISVHEDTLKNYTDSEWVEVIIDIKEKKAALEKEAEELKEAKRLQKLPEIEKAVNYIGSIVEVEIPALKQAEINEILSEFKNELKLASEKAIINLEKLK